MLDASHEMYVGGILSLAHVSLSYELYHNSAADAFAVRSERNFVIASPPVDCPNSEVSALRLCVCCILEHSHRMFKDKE